jgi:hypothetical protein
MTLALARTGQARHARRRLVAIDIGIRALTTILAISLPANYRMRPSLAAPVSLPAGAAAMRKFFFGLGVFTAVVIVASGIGIFVLARSGAELDAASKAYTKEAVVAISEHWDAGELWKRASPHLRQLAGYDKMRSLMSTADRVLGSLREFRDSKGEAMIAVNNARTAVSARYIAVASFDRGDAQFSVLLVKNGDAWEIEGFHIDWRLTGGATVGRS